MHQLRLNHNPSHCAPYARLKWNQDKRLKEKITRRATFWRRAISMTLGTLVFGEKESGGLAGFTKESTGGGGLKVHAPVRRGVLAWGSRTGKKVHQTLKAGLLRSRKGLKRRGTKGKGLNLQPLRGRRVEGESPQSGNRWVRDGCAKKRRSSPR